MSKKQVWFSLPVDFSPDAQTPKDSPVYGGKAFERLKEDPEITDPSGYSYQSLEGSSGSVQDLSEFSLPQTSMDPNTTNETYSTNESQDASSSQQESTASEGNLSHLGYEEGGSSSSPVHDVAHNELVQSAIMEVSGEFMMGKFTPQKPCSGGSESSDISDDDGRRAANGGSIAKYPESSTGLSDNDWNPYATESDTAHTPRSAASDEPRWGMVQAGRSGPNVTAPPPERFRDTTATVSMTTGEVALATGGPSDRVVSPEGQLVAKSFSDEYRVRSTLEAESYKPQYSSFRLKGQEQVERSNGQGDERSNNLDILRYVINDEQLRDTFEDDIEQKLQRMAENGRERRGNSPDMRDMRRSPQEDRRPNGDGQQARKGDPDVVRESVESSGTSKSSESLSSQRDDIRLRSEAIERDEFRLRGSAESAGSLRTGGSSRQSYESYGSGDYKRESAESARSFQTVTSSRQSTESGRSDDYRRESAESGRSLQTDGTGSGRQSMESAKSPRSLDRSGESNMSGRQSIESQGSNRSAGSRRSEQSEQSQKSSRSGSSVSDPDRLDRLNEAGESIQGLIQFESSQRNVPGFEAEPANMATRLSPSPGDTVRRVRLSARLESYAPPSQSPHRTPSPVRVGHTEYVSVAERARLMGPGTLDEDASKNSDTTHKPEIQHERPPPLESGDGFPQYSSSYSSMLPSAERSPSDVSMKRVSSLFEETKKQVRQAVAIPRPDPSGSEERFPLRDRLPYLQHADDSFKSPDRTGVSEKSAVSRDSETARSITSEEVARVLGKYAEMEKERESRRKYLCEEAAGSGANKQPSTRASAFDTVNKNQNSIETPYNEGGLMNGQPEQLDTSKVSEMSNDEITKRVRAILSNTSNVGVVGGNGTLPIGDKKPLEYVPNTIDYSRLQKDLQEIQDSLHDIPQPTANDSMNMNYHRREHCEEARDDQCRSTETFKSAETTTTCTSGRESGISDTGRRLVWDHAADLQYQEGIDGQFLGTMTSTDTLSHGINTMESTNSDTMIGRAESAMTNETERDISPPVGRESIVEQVMNRHAEGYLEESVEDIIARYRNERRDLFDRLHPAQQPNVEDMRRDKPNDKETVSNGLDAGIAQPPSPEGGPNGSQKGLAERVYKILSSDPKMYQEPSTDHAGMAKEVYKILSQDRPVDQVTGILNEALDKEQDLLKKIVQQQKLPPKEESSLDDSGLNKTNDESLSDREIRKQLEWSQFSSPGKGDRTGMSDFDAIREMTSAPYSAMNNAKTLLSSQLKKMSQQKFDKSVELRTPYRQQIQCYPVYGYEQEGKPGQGREAWMPRQTSDRDIADRQITDRQIPNRQTTDREIADRQTTEVTDKGGRSAALSSERFFLNDKDGTPPRSRFYGPDESPRIRQRTFSDPFEVSPARRSVNQEERAHHPRSKSEEASVVSDLSEYSMPDGIPQTDRRSASSPRRTHDRDLGDRSRRGDPRVVTCTPDRHRPSDNQRGNSSSPTDSDTSGSRQFAKLRPYRPAGSRDMYYTESGDDTNEESVTTQESTHAADMGSDDAIPPYIPTQYMGTRTDEANKHPTGIYSGGSRDGLSTIDEKSTGDEREKALSTGTGSGRDDQAPPRAKHGDLDPVRHTTYGRSELDSGMGTMQGRRDGDRDILSQLAAKDREPVRDAGLIGRDPARDAEMRGREAVRDREIRSRDPVWDRETRDPVRTLEPGDREPGRDVRDREPIGGREPTERGTSPSYRRDGRLAADGKDAERQERILREELGKMETRPDTASTYQRSGDFLAERPNFKTREEYRRDWERERYAEQMTRGYSDDRHEQLGTTVRSDPGGNLESHWDQGEMDDLHTFKRLEPEPAYPMDRLRYSRSKSDTDLMAMSPTESQKYSSPLQPGTKFMELSTQPSPISHQDSIKYHREQQQPGTRSIGPAHERSVKELIREQKYPLDPRNAAGQDKPLELPRVQDRPRELPRVDDKQYPMDLPKVTDRSVAPSRDLSSPVEHSRSREGDRVPEGRPRSRSDERRQSPADRARTPLRVREKELERELEEMNREVAAQVNEIQKKKLTEDAFEDSFPPSKKAQVLREVLEQEYQANIPPNINDMWTRFKDVNDRSQSESSLNSSRMDNLSGLLHNPAYHSVNKYLQEKRDQLLLEQQASEKRKAEKQSDMEKEKFLEERSQKRQELQQRHGLSEEESNGSYQEILIENERKKKERREKRDGKKDGKSDKKVRTPEKSHKSGKDKENVAKEDGKEKIIEKSEKVRVKDVSHSDTMDTLFSIPEDVSPTKSESPLKSRLKRQRHVIDPLMKKLRDKIKLQRVKIDKERRKELQRVEKLKKLEMLLSAKRKGKLCDKAIDVELHEVSSTTSVSQSESSNLFSESTLTAGSVTMETDKSSQDSTTMLDSLLESPASPKLRVKMYADKYESPKKISHLPKDAYSRGKHQYEISESDTMTQDTETSDFSNIIVEKVSHFPEKKKSEKKTSSKGKKIRVDEFGNKIRKDKKEKKDKRRQEVFGVKMSDEELAQQLRVYQKYFSPERHKKRDIGTMYPSPIVVSPPTRRRHRDVYMKSAAIQTSPSVRSCSPTHSYDEVPVAPVPYMATTRSSRRKPLPKSGSSSSVRQSSSSPVLHRSHSPANRSHSPANRSYSPANRSHSPAHRSYSPANRSQNMSRGSQTRLSTPPRKHSRSPVGPRRQAGSGSRRKKSQSPMWEPEKRSPLPKSRIWEPETPDENREPDWKQPTNVEYESALTWFVPVKPSRPWRKPLKERQAFAVQQESWEPKSVSQSTWKNIVHGDPLRNKPDINDVSRDTKFDLDPKGQLIRDEETEESDSDSDLEISRAKPLTKMTLQEAFVQRKQDTLSHLRERQKRLQFAAEERKMQTYLQLERDRLFSDDKRKEANPEAHPYSDNLYRPTRRTISKEEMKEHTVKKYKKLPEVLAAKKQQKVADEYALNRLKARLFNRKVQKHVLVRAEKWGR